MVSLGGTGQKISGVMSPMSSVQIPKHTDTLQKSPSQLHPSAGWNFEAFKLSGNSKPSLHQPDIRLRLSGPPSTVLNARLDSIIAPTSPSSNESRTQESFPPPSHAPPKRPRSPSADEQSPQNRHQPELRPSDPISQIGRGLFFEAPEGRVNVSDQRVQQVQQPPVSLRVLFPEQHHRQSGLGTNRPMPSDPRIESLKLGSAPYLSLSGPFLVDHQQHVGATIQQRSPVFPHHHSSVPQTPFRVPALEQQRGHYSEPQQRNISRSIQEQRMYVDSPNGASELRPAQMRSMGDALFQSPSVQHQLHTPKPRVLGPQIWAQDSPSSSIPPEIRIGTGNRYINAACRYPPPSPKNAYIKSVSMAPALYNMQSPNSSTLTAPQITPNRRGGRAANKAVSCALKGRPRSKIMAPQTPQYRNARSTPVRPSYNDQKTPNTADYSDMDMEDVFRRSRLAAAENGIHARIDTSLVKTMYPQQSINFKPRGQSIPVKTPAPAPRKSFKIPQDTEIINLDSSPDATPQRIRSLITPPKKPTPGKSISKKPAKIPRLSVEEEKLLADHRRQTNAAEVIVRKELCGASEALDLDIFGQLIGDSKELQKSCQEAKEAEARKKREARESVKLAEKKRAMQVLEKKRLAKEEEERDIRLLKEREEESKRIQREADRRRVVAEEKARTYARRAQTALDIEEKRKKEDEATIQRERERLQALENEKIMELIIQIRAQQDALAKEVSRLRAFNLCAAKKVSQGSRGRKYYARLGPPSRERTKGRCKDNDGRLFVSDDESSSPGLVNTSRSKHSHPDTNANDSDINDSDTTVKTNFCDEPLHWQGRDSYRQDREIERRKKIPPILEARREKIRINHLQELSSPEVTPRSHANEKTKADKVTKMPRQLKAKAKAKSKLPRSTSNLVASQILTPPDTQPDITMTNESPPKASSQLQNGVASKSCSNAIASQDSLSDKMYAPSAEPAPVAVETRFLTHAKMEELRRQAQEDEEAMKQKKIDDAKARRAEIDAKKARSRFRLKYLGDAEKDGVTLSETELAEKIENAMVKRAAEAKRRKEREARKDAIENFKDDALSSLVPKPSYAAPNRPELNLDSDGSSDPATQSRIRSESFFQKKLQARKMENTSFAQVAAKTSVFHLDNLEADESEEDPDTPGLTEKYRTAAKAGQAAAVTAPTSEREDAPITQARTFYRERETVPPDRRNSDDFDSQLVTPFRGEFAGHEPNQPSEPHLDNFSSSSGALIRDEHETVGPTPGAQNKIYRVVLKLTWHDGGEEEKRVPDKTFHILEMANHEACKYFLEFTEPKTSNLEDIEQHSNELGPMVREGREAADICHETFKAGVEPSEDQLRWMTEYAEIEVRVEEEVIQQLGAQVEAQME